MAVPGACFGCNRGRETDEAGSTNQKGNRVIKFLKFSDLGSLDNGIGGAAADKAISEATADLIDRGHIDGKPRKVAIELELYFSNGKIVANLAVQAKLPPMRTSGTHCVEKAGKGGESLLAFRDDNPDNADQPTLNDFDAKE